MVKGLRIRDSASWSRQIAFQKNGINLDLKSTFGEGGGILTPTFSTAYASCIPICFLTQLTNLLRGITVPRLPEEHHKVVLFRHVHVSYFIQTTLNIQFPLQNSCQLH